MKLPERGSQEQSRSIDFKGMFQEALLEFVDTQDPREQRTLRRFRAAFELRSQDSHRPEQEDNGLLRAVEYALSFSYQNVASGRVGRKGGAIQTSGPIDRTGEPESELNEEFKIKLRQTGEGVSLEVAEDFIRYISSENRVPLVNPVSIPGRIHIAFQKYADQAHFSPRA